MIERLEYTLSPPPPCPTNQDHLTLRHNLGLGLMFSSVRMIWK